MDDFTAKISTLSTDEILRIHLDNIKLEKRSNSHQQDELIEIIGGIDNILTTNTTTIDQITFNPYIQTCNPYKQLT